MKNPEEMAQLTSDRIRYRAEDLIELGKEILARPGFGFTKAQGYATAKMLVEADLRGDPDHGFVSGDKLQEIDQKVHDDPEVLGFKRYCRPSDLEEEDFTRDRQKYPTLLTVDAKGLLGHYVTLEMLPEIIRIAQKYGYAKAYIRNSTHFGNCGIYSEMIAEKDLAAKVTCTTAAWSLPFIAPDPDPIQNTKRYDGVIKRFGTNPIAWSVPYDEGIITIDMATTQRAVSPAVNTANDNAAALGINLDTNPPVTIGRGKRKSLLRDVHLAIAQLDNEADLQETLTGLGYDKTLRLKSVEEGLVKGPAGEDIHYPLAFDEVFKKQFWIAPLGGTFFGYKGFGLSMLVELDNVMGGGEPGLIRTLDAEGKPQTPERVTHTVEAYVLDMRYPLSEAKKRLGESVRTTRRCGNQMMFLPGEKEQLTRKNYLADGIPLSAGQVQKLQRLAQKAGIQFTLNPVA